MRLVLASNILLSEFRRLLRLSEIFPQVKCNDDIEVLKTLASVGCSFDCASSGEIVKVLSLKVKPNRIIFANTTKPASHIEFAKAKNVKLMTFDNEDEIHKIAEIHKDAE